MQVIQKTACEEAYLDQVVSCYNIRSLINRESQSLFSNSYVGLVGFEGETFICRLDIYCNAGDCQVGRSALAFAEITGSAHVHGFIGGKCDASSIQDRDEEIQIKVD